jgi:DNA polymerase-4
MGPAFVETLPVGKFHGIGPATAKKMQALGIHTGADMKSQDLPFLQRHFGKSGGYYYWVARGIDHRPVRPDRIRKSVGAENTFFTDLMTLEEARAALAPIIEKVWRYCDGHGTRGRTVTLKVKYADFQLLTRSRTGALPVASRTELEETSFGLLAPLFPSRKGIRLLGVTISTLGQDEPQIAEQMILSL